MKVAVVKNILEANQRIADENRQAFDEKGLLVINLMSSPGAGKTTLFNLLSGLYEPTHGKIPFGGQSDVLLSLLQVQILLDQLKGKYGIQPEYFLRLHQLMLDRANPPQSSLWPLRFLQA